MAHTHLDALRCAVLADSSLQHELGALTDWPAFVAAAVRLAAERGLVVSPDDLEAAAREGRRTWVERHL